jgi:hypothetical protein
MNVLKSMPVDDINLPPAVNKCDNTPTTRYFRNITTQHYSVCTTIIDLTADGSRKSLQVIVGWNYKKQSPLLGPTNTDFQHSITSIVVNPA